MAVAITALFFFVGLVMWLLVALMIIEAYMDWREKDDDL